MTRVAVAGVVTVRLAHQVDTFPVPYIASQHRTGGLSVRLSGVGWTAATTLKSLGRQVTFATYVGADALGALAVQGLRSHGWYGPATLVCDEHPRSLILYDREGKRAGTTDLRTLSTLRYPPELFGSLLDKRQHEMAILTSTPFTQELIEVALARRMPIATDMQRIADIGYPPKQDWMRAATILACSHEALPDGPVAWIHAAWRRFATPLALVGCGPGGALLGIGDRREIWHIPATTPRGVRYTNGAGDTLLAAFVHHRLALDNPVAALRYAVLTAGWRIGGSPDEQFTLSATELDALGHRHGLPAARRER